MAGMLKKLGRSAAFQNLAGSAVANYLRLVHVTSRYVIDPPDLYDNMVDEVPFIFAMWHGEHFMAPFVRRLDYKVDALISRHRDGEINAIAAHKLGIGTVRGSGSHDRSIHRKGGVPAFREMLTRLEQGTIIALTADVPKVSRVAGPGIVRLASHSGRPIIPVAITTSRHRHLSNWDRSVINLPFSRIAIAGRPAIHVPKNCDDETLEEKRQLVELELNAATERAYQLAAGEA
ncbi:lysophospholipid acyltransferase family protein [Tepidamorphus sp. 3E244]|uniref:lysophospholipid acyltransferase family protein n=1 Tax=Tepidamorphus sp. 3E244 TaxID=3385498 RepID=UPI0038FC722C